MDSTDDLFDRLWGMDGTHPFGDPFRFQEFMNSQGDGELETETFEVIKGDFKTIITCDFNKHGLLVSQSILCSYIKDDIDLDKLMQEALEKEDYVVAAAIKRRMDARKDRGNEGIGT